MAVNTLTLYMPGSSVGIQVWEGSQLHLILVSQGANSIPSAPGETVRKDPFPQYVDDDELAAALAGVGGGGGGPIDADDITDATATGKALVRASDATAARTAIGAGTSNLALGTTSTDAKAGDYAPPDASTTVKGLIELATIAVTTAGTNNQRAVTPASLKAVADTKVTSTSVSTLVVLTQATYDAIGTKSATTLYVIQG